MQNIRYPLPPGSGSPGVAGAVLTNPLDVVRNVSRAKFIDMSCLGSISVYIYILYYIYYIYYIYIYYIYILYIDNIYIYIYICLACLESYWQDVCLTDP